MYLQLPVTFMSCLTHTNQINFLLISKEGLLGSDILPELNSYFKEEFKALEREAQEGQTNQESLCQNLPEDV